MMKHNGIPYKMQSLESIYNSKKNGRPKDKYDAQLIEGYIDSLTDFMIDEEKKNNFFAQRIDAKESVVASIEEKLHASKSATL